MSPITCCGTAYAEGETSRGNAGVEEVNCLVFDMDRVPPDPKHLLEVSAAGLAPQCSRCAV